MSSNVSFLPVAASSAICLSSMAFGLLSKTSSRFERRSILTRRVRAGVAAALARRLFRLFNLEYESARLELSWNVHSVQATHNATIYDITRVVSRVEYFLILLTYEEL